jgi:DAK2 domain fusion protein YloV
VPQGREGPEGPLATARELVAAALAALEASRERIDNLNVFPVPDGDTGTNMALTVRAVRDALEHSIAANADELARDVTRAALMGARGNSGVILSQLVRGAAEALVGADVQAERGSAVARALRAASEAGYAAVREPEEGTILTVARALARRADDLAADERELGDVLADVVRAGEEALARTPEQLDVLRDAGVVDAGGAGLVEIVRGIAAQVRGEPLPKPVPGVEPLPLEAVHRERSRYRYCTGFFVDGDAVDPAALERELDGLGDSLLVVGAPGAARVHVHTDEPGRALAVATAVGILDEVDIKNMHAQTAHREQRLTSLVERTASGAVAVCAGEGNARLFRSLGAAAIVEGGETMNPATAELLAAIEAVDADEVVVLPNSRNVVLSAEQAAAAASTRALVVPTETIQAGLAAMVAFDPARPADENAAEMGEATAAVRSGGVTRASRSTALGGLAVEQGEFLGVVAGEAVACGPVLDVVAREVVERLVAGSADVLTVLVGADLVDVSKLQAEIAAAHPELEIEVQQGGQPHYPLLFAVE